MDLVIKARFSIYTYKRVIHVLLNPCNIVPTCGSQDGFRLEPVGSQETSEVWAVFTEPLPNPESPLLQVSTQYPDEIWSRHPAKRDNPPLTLVADCSDLGQQCHAAALSLKHTLADAMKCGANFVCLTRRWLSINQSSIIYLYQTSGPYQK